MADAEAERDAAIEATDAAADEEWKREAARTVRELAATRREFTADDVWDRVQKPKQPKALIGVLRAVEREGLIRSTARYARSRYRHAAAISVWESTIREAA